MEVKDLSFKLSNITVQNFLAVKRLDFTVIHGIVQAYKRTKSLFGNQIYYRIRERIPLECCAEQWPKPSWHQHEDPMFKKKIQTRNLSGMYQYLFLSRYERSKCICYVKKWHWMDPLQTFRNGIPSRLNPYKLNSCETMQYLFNEFQEHTLAVSPCTQIR